jgi:hypothetical protein
LVSGESCQQGDRVGQERVGRVPAQLYGQPADHPSDDNASGNGQKKVADESAPDITFLLSCMNRRFEENQRRRVIYQTLTAQNRV